MIKEIIKRIKSSETRAENKINKVRKEQEKRIEKVRLEIEDKWGGINKELQKIRKNIIKDHIGRAEKEAEKIKEDAGKKKNSLKKLQPKTKKIAQDIVKEIL
ncbi:MAG: hypothetical protein PF545_01600 [Elusimicrobia bacterium]|jgi:vacuolar-type H+-ATPase subunit H|nr:hypothetical protein [Elusimicrobiota bacterium]